MRLDDIRYFLAVARIGHAGRAAEATGVTQPAITKGIQRLEQALGLRLFNRTPKGMQLTAPGQIFFEKFSQISLGVEDALREANDIHHGKLGLIRIGVTPLLTEGFLNDVCVKLMAQRPAARLSLSVSLHDNLLPALEQGELDLVVSSLHESTQSQSLQTEPLFEDVLHVAARSGHPIFEKKHLQVKDLIHYNWVLPGRKIGAWQWLHSKFEALNLPAPNVVMQTNTTISNLLTVIHQTNLLTLVSVMTLATPAGQGLSVVPLDSITWHRNIGLYLRRDAYLSPLSQRFIELTRIHAHAKPSNPSA